MKRQTANHFQKHLLPSPRSFYEREFPKLSRERKGWRQTKCRFHDGQSPTSLQLNMENGGFYCFSCGVKGGDLIAFVMRRDAVTFPEACKRLGCWDDNARAVRQPRVPQREIVGRNLRFDYVIDGEHYTARVEDDPKDTLDMLRRCYHFATDRLDEINAGDAEQYAGEIDVLWGIMADSYELIRNEEQAVSHD